MKHTELIERLKDADAEEVMTTPLLEQAADAIEALKAEVERLTLACNKAAQAELDLLAERDALKLDAERYRKFALTRFGYAEGGYMNKCLRCEKQMEFVDKRCYICEECADAAMKGAA
jgi:hypothetical protein